MLHHKKMQHVVLAAMFCLIAGSAQAGGIDFADSGDDRPDSTGSDRLPEEIGTPGGVIDNCRFDDEGTSEIDVEYFFDCIDSALNTTGGGTFGDPSEPAHYDIWEGNQSGNEVDFLCVRESSPDIQSVEISIASSSLYGKFRKFEEDPTPGMGPGFGAMWNVYVSVNGIEMEIEAMDPTAGKLNSSILATLLASGIDAFMSGDYFVVTEDSFGREVTSIGLRSTNPNLISSEIALEPDTEPTDGTNCQESL